jgi:ATP-binding cassette subfamily B protein
MNIRPSQRAQFQKASSLIGPIFRKYRLQLSIGLGAMLLVDILQLYVPRVIKSTIDGLNQGIFTDTDLLRNAWIIVGLAVGIGSFRFVWRYLIIGFSRILERDIRDQLFSHILTLDKAFFQKKTTGDMIALSTNDLTAVQLACGMGLVAFVDAFIMLFAAISFMIYINPILTAVALFPLPLLAILTKSLAGKLHKRFKEVQEQFSTITQFARSAISSIRLIKIYNQQDNQGRQFNRLGRQYISQNIKTARIQGVLFPVSTMIANASLLLVVFFGGRMTILRHITIGDFVAFMTYLFMLTWPMMAIGWVANLFQRGLTSLERIKDILDVEPQLSVHGGIDCTQAPETVSVRNLTFTYPQSNKPVLREIDLHFSQGLIGLVGPTGCGKSTLCELLARLYKVPDNTITWDRSDINTLSLKSTRSMISFVPQNTHLFSNTISFNISLAKPEATQEEIEMAAKTASIHTEILNLPNGYETRIGEKGVKLSGGQKQRIALARALLADKPILIIDDGLSAVDVNTENTILQNLSILFRNKIVLFASHRLHPLTSAKKVVVLEEGKITAIGSHSELLERNEFFRTIYNHQNNSRVTTDA